MGQLEPGCQSIRPLLFFFDAVEEITRHKISLFKVLQRPHERVRDNLIVHLKAGGVEEGDDFDFGGVAVGNGRTKFIVDVPAR